MKRDAYERTGGHQDISILVDYDLSVRMFREGDIACCDDRRPAAYTSARRFEKLPSFLMTFLHGHYHYHVTKDPEQLLQYPRFDALERHLLTGAGGLERWRWKTRPEYAKLVSGGRRKHHRPQMVPPHGSFAHVCMAGPADQGERILMGLPDDSSQSNL